jgi:hypothetical protein
VTRPSAGSTTQRAHITPTEETFTTPRRRMLLLLRRYSSSLHMRSVAHLPQTSLFAAKGITVPRSSCARKPLRSFFSRSALSGVAARHSPKSRGRILHRCRSALTHPTCITAPSSFSSSPYTSQQRAFSSTPIAMTATKIDGTAIAKKIREKLHAEIVETQKTNPRYKPSLKIIQGDLSIHCLDIVTNIRNHSRR